MTTMNESYELRDSNGGLPIKSWTRGVPVESEAIKQRAAGRYHPKPSLDPVQRRRIQQECEPLRWRDFAQFYFFFRRFDLFPSAA